MGTAAGLTSLAMGGKIPGAGRLGRIFGAGSGTVVAETALANGAAATGAPAAGAAVGGETLATLAGRASFAMAPLVAMYGMSEWAEDTSKDKERIESRQAVGGALETVLGWFGFDKSADIEARRSANRAELGGEDTKPAEVNATLTVGLAPGLVLVNQAVQATGQVRMNTGNINGVPG